MKFIFFFLQICLLVPGGILEGRAQELKEGYYPDGKLRYKGYFLNGQPAGEVTHYYPDGKVKAVMNHRGKQAEAVLYSRDGEFKTSGRYMDRKKEGVWEYRKGEKLLLSEEYSGDRLNGAATRYYPTGAVAEVKNWKDGGLSGVWKLFYESGKLRSEVTFSAGKLNGKLRSYNSDGVLVAEGEYRNDLKEGIWQFFYPDGKLERTVIYHAGTAENEEEAIREDSRRIDELMNSGKKFADPALFKDDPEGYMKLSGLIR